MNLNKLLAHIRPLEKNSSLRVFSFSKVLFYFVVTFCCVSSVLAQPTDEISGSDSVKLETANLSIDEIFARELRWVEDLKAYNQQLTDQISGQDKAAEDIQLSIDKAKLLEPQVVPLMQEMINTLNHFIRLDIPFHSGTRKEGIQELQQIMTQTGLSTSDRFRRIVDNYTIELEYGNTYEAYADIQPLNGEKVEVDMLRIGRLALYYQSKDGKKSAMWNKQSKQWVSLPESANRHIRKAIKVAAKQVAPELMLLPISSPEVK